jgi:hypothetical protein
MIAEIITSRGDFKYFEKVSADVYNGNNYYRGTEGSIEKLLLNSKSAFQNHASIQKFVVRDGNDLVARFALIHDLRLMDYCQISFFEAQPGLGDIFPLIRKQIENHFPQCKKVVAGLNAHLNYGAGILLHPFDEPPLFGLPYNPAYYADYFKAFTMRKMVTFRFDMEAYAHWANSYPVNRPLDGLTIRFMDKSRIKEESAIYTRLNNLSFQQHPYWANRDEAEDLELFYPFRHLLDNENLIIAEIKGKPVGFFLWYPDFNKLVTTHRDLNLWDVIRFRTGKYIDTFRVTEIGVVPEYQRSPVAMEMIRKSLPTLYKKGYKFCEVGFIFEENRASIAMLKRLLTRLYGTEALPYRQFATFEMGL